jgi:hypothetical protein
VKVDLLTLEISVARHQTVLQEADLSLQRRTDSISQTTRILRETSLTRPRSCHILVCELNIVLAEMMNFICSFENERVIEFLHLFKQLENTSTGQRCDFIGDRHIERNRRTLVVNSKFCNDK